MKFNNFRVNIIIRIGLITITVFALANLLNNHPFTISQLIVLALLVGQVLSLFKYLDRIHTETVAFLNSIQYDEYNPIYKHKQDSSLDFLYQEFDSLSRKMREIRAEKDEQYYYLKNIVKHLGIGLITFDKEGKVQIVNTTAKRFFDVKDIKNIRELQTLSPILVESFFRLRTGGSDLVKLEKNGEIVQLSIYAIELTLRGEAFKLISLQNIQSELEEKEMEAWQNLIRVLTHEIMNSVTPISSLAASVEQELLAYINVNEIDEKHQIDQEEMEDIHTAVQTIQRRSEGLIRFVSDFRNLTRIPIPKIGKVLVRDLFNRIKVLLRNDFKSGNINLIINLSHDELTLSADQELIEQVLINLLKNAIQALEEKEGEKVIELASYVENRRRVIIKVKDNGVGIEEDALDKIFIPFFTTKKNGSGIGLSLSKQIMRQHKANISVKSTMEEGTEFILKF